MKDGRETAGCLSSTRVLSERSEFTREGEGYPGGPRLAVRLGMRFIKGLKQTTGKAIEKEREKGFFEDVADFSRRCRLRRSSRR